MLANERSLPGDRAIRPLRVHSDGRRHFAGSGIALERAQWLQADRGAEDVKE